MTLQMPLRVALLSALLLTGCAKQKPVAASTPTPPPPQPTAPRKTPATRPLVEGDLLIKNCAVAHQEGDKVTCNCRHARTNIDAKGRGYMVVECR